MSVKVHIEAADRAEELLRSALAGLKNDASPIRAPSGAGYVPDVHVAASIGPSDMLGPMLSQEADRFGRITARLLSGDGAQLRLAGAAHDDFERAVRVLHGQREVRQAVSRTTLEQVLFQWLCDSHLGKTSEPLVSHIVRRLGELIRPIEVLLPVYDLNVQVPMQVGNVVFADLTQDELTSWMAKEKQRFPDRSEMVEDFIGKLTVRFRGKAVARYAAVAETEHAYAMATEEAQLSLAVLRLVSIGALMPERATPFALVGEEVVPQYNRIAIGLDEFALNFSRGVVYAHDQRTAITQQNRDAVWARIAHWSELLQRGAKTDFERAALRSLLLYSRATRHRNLSEKLLHVFAALESLLLRSESEPIAVMMGDRLAFAVGRNVNQRRDIVKSVRDVYSLRSKFVHHGIEDPPDSELLARLEAFLATVGQLFFELGGFLKSMSTKADFLDALDARKYS